MAVIRLTRLLRLIAMAFPRRLPAVLIVALGAGALGAGPAAVVNDRAVLVLHAVPASAHATCGSPEIASFDCSSGATVSVGPMERLDVFLFVHDYDDLAGVQCRLSWPGDWTFGGWTNGCGTNQIVLPLAAGPDYWELVTVFDAVTGSSRSEPIGSLSITTGLSGCLTIAESTYDKGTHVLTGGSAPIATPIPAERRGTVCAGQPGVDGCSLGTTLHTSSWGAIKAGFGY